MSEQTSEKMSEQPSGKTLSGSIEPGEARLLLAKHEAVALDLRGDVVAETGRPPSATVVVDGDLDDAIERARTEGEDGELPILVFDDDAGRAKEVAEQLRERGIEAAYVKGGWDAWTSEGQPVQPKPDVEFEGPDLSKVPGAGN